MIATWVPMSWMFAGWCMDGGISNAPPEPKDSKFVRGDVATHAGDAIIVEMKPAASTSLPHIVVIGAGFGGLTFCQKFPKKLARITLIDRQNHHLFQPLLYQVASAGLAAVDIAQPVRAIFGDRPNFN